VLDVTTEPQPGVSWIFSNMRLMAVVGGAITAAGIASIAGLVVLDCCLNSSSSNKVVAE
jgi:hypothetical protein